MPVRPFGAEQTSGTNQRFCPDDQRHWDRVQNFLEKRMTACFAEGINGPNQAFMLEARGHYLHGKSDYHDLSDLLPEN